VELHVDDAGFVRAPAFMVYRRLTHIGAWPSWWPGVRVREAAPSSSGEAMWSIELAAARARRLRYALRPHGWRPEQGFHMDVDGEVVGTAEFWLEPTNGGTVVHHLLAARSSSPRPARVLADHRRAIRQGLWGLKDAVQLEARTSIGLTP